MVGEEEAVRKTDDDEENNEMQVGKETAGTTSGRKDSQRAAQALRESTAAAESQPQEEKGWRSRKQNAAEKPPTEPSKNTGKVNASRPKRRTMGKHANQDHVQKTKTKGNAQGPQDQSRRKYAK